MRKLIVLPGNSPRNKAWSERVADHFGGLFDAVYVQAYDHWDTGTETIDFVREGEKLRTAVSADADDTEQYVFAKSLGTILTFRAVHKGYIRPQRCVFFGVPLNVAAEQHMFENNWTPVDAFAVPALAFQNEHDPTANYAYTTARLPASVRVISRPDDTHAYTEFGAYEQTIKEFLAL